MVAQVVLLDDDPATVQTVQTVLKGSDCQLRCAAPEPGLAQALTQEPPDLVVLGINDGATGWPLCRELLARLEVPLFLLLASRQEADRVRGLKMGAVECLSKGTCGPVELAARLRAALRRSPGPGGHREKPARPYVDGELVVDLHREEVWLAGRLVPLTPIEWRILAGLARQAGHPLPYGELLAEVWGVEAGRGRRALRPHIYHLRRKLEADPARPRRIVTWRGRGYLLQRVRA